VGTLGTIPDGHECTGLRASYKGSKRIKVSPSLLVRGQPRAAGDKKEGRRLSVGMTCSGPTPQDGAARTRIVLVREAPGK
jgi:hypothetical protein